MKKLTHLNFEDDGLKSYTRDEVHVLNVKKNIFEIAIDLTESNYLFNLLSLSNEDPGIKVIFLYNNPGSLGEESYHGYLSNLMGNEPGKSTPFLSDPNRQTMRGRQINILNHFIQEILEIRKLFVIGLQGGVVTPFFGASLTADLRFAADDMYFSLAHKRYGIHPAGGLPLFLPKYVGLSRARDILFRADKISVTRALELGLVNQIFPAENFLGHCLKALEDISLLSKNVIQSTKQLMKLDSKEIERYLAEEEKLIYF